MKKYLLLCLVAAVGSQLFAQQLTPRLVASSGTVLSNGQTNISFSVGEPVTRTLAAGTIILNQGFQQPQLANDTLGLFIPVISGQCGTSLDIPVRAYNFQSLLTMQGSINWGPTQLRFESIANFGPATLGLSAANFGVTEVASGRLRFSWNDPKTQGVTLPDTTTLFVIRFAAIDTMNRTIPVSITGTPTPLEFYDSQLKKKPYVVRNGAVNLLCALTISGRLITPLNQGVPLGTVGVTGTESMSTLSDANGRYTLKVRPGNYTLTSSKNNEKSKLNGVSTLDLALIQAHILNNTPLNSPYKIIAADADGSNAVSTADILYLRRMILGIDTSLPGNRTWAFVDSAQSFTNPAVPFPYSSSKTYSNLSVNVNQTFRAVKLGDVNWDRNPLVGQPLYMDTMKLFTEAVGEPNHELVVRIKAREVKDVMGFQFTIQWDRNELQFLGVGVNPFGVNFGERWVKDGYLALSWNDTRVQGLTMNKGDLFFELRFSRIINIAGSRLLVGSWKAEEEVFDRQYNPMFLVMEEMEIPGQTADFDPGLQVYPNPAGRVVNVEWDSKVEGTGTISLMDPAGSKVFEQKVKVETGRNKVRLTLDDQRIRKGIYILHLEASGSIKTAKLVVTM